jgi:hypothetical protein
VIGREADDFRLFNARGQPYLYPHQLFDIVDAHEPEDWVTGSCRIIVDLSTLRALRASMTPTSPVSRRSSPRRQDMYYEFTILKLIASLSFFAVFCSWRSSGKV